MEHAGKLRGRSRSQSPKVTLHAELYMFEILRKDNVQHFLDERCEVFEALAKILKEQILREASSCDRCFAERNYRSRNDYGGHFLSRWGNILDYERATQRLGETEEEQSTIDSTEVCYVCGSRQLRSSIEEL